MNDPGDLKRVNTLVRDADHFGVLVCERTALDGALAAFEDARIRFTGIRECLAFAISDVQQPHLAPCLLQPDTRPFAVVENMGDLVDDEVGKGIVLGKVLGRYITRRFLANSHQIRLGLAEQLGATACKVQVGDSPRRPVKRLGAQYCLEVRTRHE